VQALEEESPKLLIEDNLLIGDVAEAQVLKAKEANLSSRSNSSGDLDIDKMHENNE
jgi:hypothetical protein